jgi:hypothetical protein
MNEKQLMKLFLEDPKKFISYLEQSGVDLVQSSKELDLARRLVVQKFNMNEEAIRATEFVFWISYFAERELRESILKVENTQGVTTPMLEGMLDRLDFGDKISLVERHYQEGKSNFTKLYWKINNLRNDVAHGRISELVYDGLKLSDISGQLKLLSDFIKSTKTQI